MADNDDDWLSTQPAEPLASGTGGGGSPRRLLAVRAGLVSAGAVVGGALVIAVAHGASSSPTAPSALLGAPAASGRAPGLPAGPNGAAPGGLAGEQRLVGTLVSVGASSVTVRTGSGSATYQVVDTSQIVRNGRVVSLTALRAGDSVFGRVYPSGSPSGLVVERLFAGTPGRALTGFSQEVFSRQAVTSRILGAWCGPIPTRGEASRWPGPAPTMRPKHGCSSWTTNPTSSSCCR